MKYLAPMDVAVCLLHLPGFHFFLLSVTTCTWVLLVFFCLSLGYVCSLNSRLLQVWAILLTIELFIDMPRCNIWVEMLNSLETGGGLECQEESLCVEQDLSLQLIYA